jgi:hypothetical protein
VPLVGPNIRRVDVEERVLGVAASDDTWGIAALDLHPLQTNGAIGRKSRPLVVEVFTGAARPIVATAAVKRVSVRKAGKHPDRPRPFHAVKQVFVNRLCLTVKLSAVKAYRYLFFECRKAPPQYLVKIDKLAVGVVDDFDTRRLFSEEYRNPAEERFAEIPCSGIGIRIIFSSCCLPP